MKLKALVLSPEDRSGLEKVVAKGRDWRMRHRAQTLLYFADGWRAKEIKNMSRSAAGNADKPGKNVAAKSGLNKAILDQGWFEFRRQLNYKLDWNGGILIAVPPQYTSQTCPCCDHVAKANRQTQAKFECMECGYANNADVVGATNILARGYRAAACGEDGSVARKRRAKPASAKQEPTEATRQESTHV